MSELETIKTTRDVKAVLVPFGDEVVLPSGSEVIVLQALGGAYTVIAGGQTLRITEDNADALGKSKNEANSIINDPALSLEDKIWAQLKTCYDPEIPVDIVDLGLVYEVGVEALSLTEQEQEKKTQQAQEPRQEEYKAIIKMTLTAPGCGMGPIIAAEAKQKVLAIPKIKEVEMIMVFDPPWDRSRMSEVAKLALGL